MYKQYLEIRDTKIGLGVFSTVQIPANTPIMELRGPVLVDRDLPDINDPEILQVGPNTYMTASGEIGDHINHNCEPNCKMHVVGNRAFLYSLYVIPAGAELTFDYSTTSTESQDSWKMDCKCGSFKCRKTVSGHQYLNSDIKKHYEDNNMLPLYIISPNLIQRK